MLICLAFERRADNTDRGFISPRDYVNTHARYGIQEHRRSNRGHRHRLQMNAKASEILPPIRTLPLPNDEMKAIFSRAVQLVHARPADFVAVGEWLDNYYSTAKQQSLCEKAYRQEFAWRLRSMRHDSHTFHRRLEIQNGRPIIELKQERAREALYRGERLKDGRIVTRSHPEPHPDERLVDLDNAHHVFAWDDEQYRRRFKQVKAERRMATLKQWDHPERPGWRLARAVSEIIDAGYPSDTLAEHAAQSRKIVGLAALLVWPEQLLTLGEFGRWEWESKPAATPPASAGRSVDELSRDLAKPPEQDRPHKVPLDLFHERELGREEALFHRMPGESRELQSQWGDLSGFCQLLCVAVDELEAILEHVSQAAKAGSVHLDVPSPAQAKPELPGGAAGIEQSNVNHSASVGVAAVATNIAASAGEDRQSERLATSSVDPAPPVRRGRLTREDSEAKRAAFLATIVRHPSMKEDLLGLAKSTGVSESTARRWLAAEEERYRQSRAAGPGSISGFCISCKDSLSGMSVCDVCGAELTDECAECHREKAHGEVTPG